MYIFAAVYNGLGKHLLVIIGLVQPFLLFVGHISNRKFIVKYEKQNERRAVYAMKMWITAYTLVYIRRKCCTCCHDACIAYEIIVYSYI